MIFPRITLAITTVITVAACSPSGNPHLDMCMKITSNILNSDVEFGEILESKNKREMRMTLPYTSNGASNEALCVFAVENASNDTYRTAPKEVTIDGIKLGTKELMRASLASSKDVLEDTANETTKQATAAAEEAKVMASEAKDKAAELADEAKVKATELADEAKAKAGEVATQIKDSEAVTRAKDLAGETTDKAKAAIVEGAKAVQQKLEN